MADVIYNSFFKDLGNGVIDLETDDFKLMLVTSTYTPDVDSHDRRDDVTNEVSGDGYTAGGAMLGTVTFTQDNAGDQAVFDAANVVWENSSVTARGAVLYKATGGASSTDPLIKYFDFGEDKTSVNAAFTVAFHADGILQIKTGT